MEPRDRQREAAGARNAEEEGEEEHEEKRVEEDIVQEGEAEKEEMSRALWAAVIFLAVLGGLAGVMRAAFPADLVGLVEPVRTRMFQRLGLTDPNPELRRADVAEIDARFGRYRVTTLMHVLPGAAFLLLAPFQFSRKLRGRFPTAHRWLGRVLLLAAVIAGFSGLFFGAYIPFAGNAERIIISAAGGALFVAIGCGFAAVRRGDSARHREWMIRVFALMLAISVIRVIASALDLALSPRGYPPRLVFVLSLWSGWVATVVFAEWWIRYGSKRSALDAAGHDPRDVVLLQSEE